VSLLLLVLFSAAIAVVFTQGSIFSPLRTHGPKLWRELVSCGLCSGTWIGGVAAALLLPVDLTVQSAFLVLGTGCASGALAWFFGMIIEVLDTISG
jgi:hypothetical protein